MIISILLLCATLCHAHPSTQEILHQFEQLCSQCRETTEAELKQLQKYCNNYYAQVDTSASSSQQDFPASDPHELLEELDGLDWPEMPDKETINCYRPEEPIPYNYHQIRMVLGAITSLSRREINEQLRLLQHLQQPPQQRMYSQLREEQKKIEKERRESFNSAVISKMNLDLELGHHKHLSSEKRNMYEQAYIANARLFIWAHDKGYPHSIDEAIKTITQGPITRITDKKCKRQQPEAPIIDLCRDITHRKYAADGDMTPELIMAHTYVTLPHAESFYHTKGATAVSKALFEQAWYTLTNNCIMAHDKGHPTALAFAEELMSRAEILSIVESNKQHGLHATAQFAALWRAIEARRSHSITIEQAQQEHGSSHAASSVPVEEAPSGLPDTSTQPKAEPAA